MPGEHITCKLVEKKKKKKNFCSKNATEQSTSIQNRCMLYGLERNREAFRAWKIPNFYQQGSSDGITKKGFPFKAFFYNLLMASKIHEIESLFEFCNSVQHSLGMDFKLIILLAFI